MASSAAAKKNAARKRKPAKEVVTAQSLIDELPEKQKFVFMKTPRGRSRWAWVTKPDEYKGNKRYKIDLLFDDPEVIADYIRLIDEFAELHMETMRANPRGKTAAAKKKFLAKLTFDDNKPYGDVEDEEGNATGAQYLRFRCGTKFTDSKGQTRKIRPKIFDGGGRVLTQKNLIIGNDSICQVAFSFVPYMLDGKVGCSLRLQGVLIHQLETYSAGASASQMFGDDVDEEAEDLTQREFQSPDGDDDGEDTETEEDDDEEVEEADDEGDF